MNYRTIIHEVCILYVKFTQKSLVVYTPVEPNFFPAISVVLYANLMSLERGDSQLSNDTKFVEKGSKNAGQNRFSDNMPLNIEN